MKLNYTLTYMIYFGLTVMLSSLKDNCTAPGFTSTNKNMAIVKVTKPKAEVLHSELLFKY